MKGFATITSIIAALCAPAFPAVSQIAPTTTNQGLLDFVNNGWCHHQGDFLGVPFMDCRLPGQSDSTEAYRDISISFTEDRIQLRGYRNEYQIHSVTVPSKEPESGFLANVLRRFTRRTETDDVRFLGIYMPQEHVMFSIPRRPAEFSFAVAMLLITWIIVHQVICPNNNGCQPTSTPAATTTTPETESFCLILPTIIITPPEIDVIPSPTDSLFSPMPEPASPIESDCSSSSSSIGTESPTLYASSVTSMSDDDSCDSEDDLPPTLGFSVSASRSFTNLQDLVASQDGEPSAHDEPELPRSGWYDDDEDNDIGPIPTFDTPSFLTDPPEPDPPTELNDDVPFIVFPSLEYVPIRQQIRQRVHAIMGVPSPIATEPESCLDAAEDSQPELASTPTSFIAPTSSRLKPLVHDPWFPTHEPATVTYVERTEIAYSDEFVSDEDEDDEEEELRIETEAMTRLNNVRSVTAAPPNSREGTPEVEGDLLDGRKASKLRWGVEYTRSLEDGHKDEVLMILSAMETFAEECQEAKYEYGSFGVSDHDA